MSTIEDHRSAILRRLRALLKTGRVTQVEFVAGADCSRRTLTKFLGDEDIGFSSLRGIETRLAELEARSVDEAAGAREAAVAAAQRQHTTPTTADSSP